MVVYDIDGDGDNDVITSSAHDYGIWWFEQLPGGKFEKHMRICKTFSQTHAIRLADINRDGIMDFVTGKRYFAHNGKDPGAFEPALLVWFEIQRPEKGKAQFVQHTIDENSGIGTQFEVVDIERRRPDGHRHGQQEGRPPVPAGGPAATPSRSLTARPSTAGKAISTSSASRTARSSRAV